MASLTVRRRCASTGWGLTITGSAPRHSSTKPSPSRSQQLYENFACKSDRNFTGYCNRRLEDLFHQQSRETDPQSRRELVWDIDGTLQEEGARPVIFHTRGATCWQPQVKGLTTMVNSMVNGWRMEDVWLDK